MENAGTVTTSVSSGLALDVNGSHAATAAVSGTNSLLQFSGPVAIGDSTTRALTVSSGALFDAGTSNINIGNQAGGAGTVTVSGGGATLKSGSLNVSIVTGSAGTLSVDSGGTVNVSTLTVGGTTTLNGGVLDATVQLQFVTGGTLNGYGTIDTPLLNAGSITANGGTLEVTGGTVIFAPVFDIMSGAGLWLDSAISGAAPAPVVTFDTGAAAETLILGAPQVTNSLTIANWQNGDLLEFGNGAAATNVFMQNGNTLVVDVTGAGTTTSYSFTNVSLAAGTSPVFTVGTDGGNNNSYVELVSCFAPGTRIRTTQGDVLVESLAVADAVITASGKTRSVRWIGHRRIGLTRHPAPALAQPIRVRADANRRRRTRPRPAVIAGPCGVP